MFSRLGTPAPGSANRPVAATSARQRRGRQGAGASPGKERNRAFARDGSPKGRDPASRLRDLRGLASAVSRARSGVSRTRPALLSHFQTRVFDGFFPVSQEGLKVFALLKRFQEHSGVARYACNFNIIR